MSDKKDSQLLKWAWRATSFWLALFFTYVIAKWSKVVALAPNEFGDFLAGAFAPLAFAGLVVAVFLQKDELQDQRLEFQNLVKQQVINNNLEEKKAEQLRTKNIAASMPEAVKALLREIILRSPECRIAYSQRGTTFGDLADVEEFVNSRGHALFGQTTEAQEHLNNERIAEAIHVIKKTIDQHCVAFERDTTTPVVSESFHANVGFIDNELRRIIDRYSLVPDAEGMEKFRAYRLADLQNSLASILRTPPERFAAPHPIA